MIDATSKRFLALNKRYKSVTGQILPMEMISHVESYENLEAHVKACEEAGRDLLPQIYGWDLDGSLIY